MTVPSANPTQSPTCGVPLIHNPVLPGFNPDPSICRVGADYYIATSTFEWFPGVQIHHSRDLVHWRLLTRALQTLSHLNMLGVPDSGGIWAPCLTWADGLFYLLYTNVSGSPFPFCNTPNYLVTAHDIQGPWSDPIFLNSSGFDPSLFHDTDGRKYLLNMLMDHRPDHPNFPGIVLQEYDPSKKQLTGPVHKIFAGSLGATEGPHLYRHGGYYHLMVAEGGTGYNHAVTMARSKDLLGPYEVDPRNPFCTSRWDDSLVLKRAGHASLVETQGGEFYIAHLCGRPHLPEKYCNLGRETALQKCTWSEDGWLRLAHGDWRPQVDVPAPDLPPHRFPAAPIRDDFDLASLGVHYQSLRIPITEDWASLTERPGHLRLYGQESPRSNQRQSVIARRLQAFHAAVTTELDYHPVTFQQLAGLTAFYNLANFFYLAVTHKEGQGRCVHLLVCENGKTRFGSSFLPLDAGAVRLKIEIAERAMTFAFAQERSDWIPVGQTEDAGKLSDQYCQGHAFTGTFLGMAAHDMGGTRLPADFDYFTYQENS